jgi:predicted XRE-type DNA-binding protein
MIRIEKTVKRSALAPSAAATRLGIAQLRLNALLRGKIGEFSLDDLVRIAVRAGLRFELRIARQNSDR